MGLPGPALPCPVTNLQGRPADLARSAVNNILHKSHSDDQIAAAPLKFAGGFLRRRCPYVDAVPLVWYHSVMVTFLASLLPFTPALAIIAWAVLGC